MQMSESRIASHHPLTMRAAGVIAIIITDNQLLQTQRREKVIGHREEADDASHRNIDR